MSDDQNPNAWMPFSIAEASLKPIGDGDLGLAWAHLLDRLQAASATVHNSSFTRNDVDRAAGIRHLLALLAIGIDELLRYETNPVPAVTHTTTDDSIDWGMGCPDSLYTRAPLRGDGAYRLYGNRGTARYVGLQTTNGVVATMNRLVDDLDVHPDGTFELILSADEREGNWMKIDGENPVLIVRHFFYDWETEVASNLHIEPLDSAAEQPALAATLDVTLPRQIDALADFLHDNLDFFIAFGSAAPANGFLPGADFSSQGAAAENRPVIGRFELDPDEALILEVSPPEGVYWSYSVGNPWWETIHFGRHQCSLNGHQAVADADGKVRAVVSAQDPGIANWLDNAGFSNGPIILRCVRTESAPQPDTKVVKFAEVHDHLPPGTVRVSAADRAATVAARRHAVQRRFAR